MPRHGRQRSRRSRAASGPHFRQLHHPPGARPRTARHRALPSQTRGPRHSRSGLRPRSRHLLFRTSARAAVASGARPCGGPEDSGRPSTERRNACSDLSVNRAERARVFACMRQNLRYALRRLKAEPGFALVVVLAMGLGIGMNTTVFTLVNAVLLRGLPYDKADELVVAESFDRQQRSGRGVSWSDFDDWQRDAQSFQGLAAMRNLAMNRTGNPGAPERAQGWRGRPNTFGRLGQPMHLGRDFVAADGEPGAPPVMIIGYGLWERRWAGDPNVIGSYVRVNEVPTQIVGVMQKGVRFPANSDAWVPLPRSMSDARDNRVLNVFGRLKPGVSIEQAETELNGIAARLEQAHPATNRNIEADVMTFNQRMNGGPIRAVFLMLLAAVSLLLLIACANVANLLIARAVARTREISVRIALGASRRTIIGQLLTESVTLGVLG